MNKKMSTKNKTDADVLIIGASAAGLMCAIEAAKRGRNVIVLDHANKAGKKILMSGGGHCNFTNYTINADNYLSNNPHFVKSALSRYTQWDFIALVEKYGIAIEERKHGQLFCDRDKHDSAKDILAMLLSECAEYGVTIELNVAIESVIKTEDDYFSIVSRDQLYYSASLVIASGGLSIPKMCATPFGYQIAEQFDLPIQPTRAGLVPFTLQDKDKNKFATLSGIAVDAMVSCERIQFHEAILFTHRGLSGPAILQTSSYWQAGEAVVINLLPDIDLFAELKTQREAGVQQNIKALLANLLPKRLVEVFIEKPLLDINLQNLSDTQISTITQQLQQWTIKPNGTEGYRTAEVTIGGVDCDAVSSKTFETKSVQGLYFVGEVLDVTGWLGGYNFQWAWSSGWCAGQYV